MITCGYNANTQFIVSVFPTPGHPNTAKLLAAVKPGYIIISCGLDNSYGHPHAEILKRFQQSGAKIYRTDHNGSIVVSVSPGGEVSVHPTTESEAA